MTLRDCPRLVTLEGGEGAGKTTVLNALREMLRAGGAEVVSAALVCVAAVADFFDGGSAARDGLTHMPIRDALAETHQHLKTACEYESYFQTHRRSIPFLVRNRVGKAA